MTDITTDITNAILTSIITTSIVSVEVTCLDDVFAADGYEDSVLVAPGRYDVWGTDDGGSAWRLDVRVTPSQG